ncbi:MAG: polysaccharide biosynthesis tyrosine autokinase [Candidatus Binatia bacterium]
MKEISPWRIRRLAQPEHIQPEYTYIPESEVSLGEYWNVIVKRRRVILLFLLVIFSAAAYFALSATTLYTAAATVKIEQHNPRVTGMGDLQPIETRGDYDYHQTQFALLGSRALAARVINELGLKDNKIFTESVVVSPNPVDHVKSWMFRILRYFSYYLAPLFRSEPEADSLPTISPMSSLDKAALELTVSPYLIDQYLSSINVAPVLNTRLVRVNFTTSDPSLSQALANVHVQTFVLMSFEGRFSLTKEAREFLDEKKTEIRQKLEKSEIELNSFRRAHGVVSVEKGENIVVDRLVDLNKQLTAVRAQRIEAESLYRTVENRNYQDLAEIMRQGLVQQLKGNIATLEAEKARLATIFTSDHPRIQELNKQIASAREAFDSEIATVVRSIKSSYAAALARESGLQSEAERQQQDALRLKELGIDYTILQGEVNANRALYDSILKRLTETNVSNDLAISNMQITERAAKPVYPSGPNVPGYLIAGLISGLVFGLGAAFLLEFFDSTLHTPDDVWRSVGLSTLGVVPHLKSLKPKAFAGGQIDGPGTKDSHISNGSNGGHAASKDLIIGRNPISIINESYRTIRTSLLLSQAEKPPQVIVLTSPSPGEGKTVTTVNLAIALSRDGYSVLIIDGDMRKGSCHDRLGLRNNKGLSNVLTGRISVEEAIQQTSISGLRLLSRGGVPPNPIELLGSPKMKNLVQELRRTVQFILIDSPPIVGISDAAVLSVMSDGVLLVLNGQITSTAVAQKAVERLDMVRAHLLGAILNGVDLQDPHYSYYRSYEPYLTYRLANEEDGVEANGNGSNHAVHDDDNGSITVQAGTTKEPRQATNGTEGAFDSESFKEVKRNGASSLAGAEESAEAGKIEAVYAGTSELSAEASPSKSQAMAPVSQEALPRVIEALTKTIGPIALTIVHEHIAALGESRYAFPENRIDELLKSLQAGITDDESKLFSRHFSGKDSGSLIG